MGRWCTVVTVADASRRELAPTERMYQLDFAAKGGTTGAAGEIVARWGRDLDLDVLVEEGSATSMGWRGLSFLYCTTARVLVPILLDDEQVALGRLAGGRVRWSILAVETLRSLSPETELDVEVWDMS